MLSTVMTFPEISRTIAVFAGSETRTRRLDTTGAVVSPVEATLADVGVSTVAMSASLPR
jgi:hypothetical protein